MIRAVPVRIFRQVLLVIFGAETFSCTELAELSRYLVELTSSVDFR